MAKRLGGMAGNGNDIQRHLDKKLANAAISKPTSIALSGDQVAVMIGLMENAQAHQGRLNEAQARMQAYAGQMISASGLHPVNEYHVNWDKKCIEKIPPAPKPAPVPEPPAPPTE